VVGNGEICWTTDGGTTWENRSSANTDITNVLLRTTNGGETWFEESDDGNVSAGLLYGVHMVTSELGLAVGQNRRIFRRLVQ
jgi:photosystem II stability/assembly factor-like uncharacterized protein